MLRKKNIVFQKRGFSIYHGQANRARPQLQVCHYTHVLKIHLHTETRHSTNYVNFERWKMFHVHIFSRDGSPMKEMPAPGGVWRH